MPIKNETEMTGELYDDCDGTILFENKFQGLWD
jgi:hypothetical protein